MSKKGFTLIEMMVAVSIFAIVAFIATGAFISLSKANRKAQAIKLAIDNLNFAMDSMAFKLREGANIESGAGAGGYDYYSTDGCGISGGFSAVGLKYPNDGSVTIYYEYSRPDHTITLRDNGGNTAVGITSSEIKIDKFCILPKVSTNGQDFITILIQGTVQAIDSPTAFLVQTSVSKRN